ncbi:uncharacterized protein I303_106988 [Kwoniella dejecticola CBS 10117]|uniref:Gluconolactonase n=1 Tax=Kwoniella dejecticola CBS 10117 TaxID=1296121 RepID=A0A1A5ZYE6_9TREE|nr:uncharacterized protein I303_06389 [Kwoniella dejecticola CBS 10117]OBR82832.1 hypothetical protein I303_06389 [Kwoniella dejecticola CBS 10117]
MPTAVTAPKNPLHPSVLPRLDKQYEAFYNKYMANAPMIQDLPWDPAVRSSPAVPGGAPALPVSKTEDINLGEFSIRVFYPIGAPEGPLPIFIWYHGGGMVLGGINAENPFCTRVANSAKCVVVTVDYRMAPEYQFPIGHEDAWTAFEWVYKNGKDKLGVDVGRFGIGGSSSGGNLAAFVSQKAGLQGIPINFMVLGVPVCDNTATAESYKSWNVNRYCPGLPDAKMLWYRDQYLPKEEDRSDPIASPLFGSDEAFKASVNKVFIALAELDLLRSEGEAYSEKLKSFGKDVDCRTYPGVPHAVQAMDGVLDMARKWIKDMCTFVAVQFGRHPADVAMEDLYPENVEVDVPQIEGGGPWLKLNSPMVLGEAPLYREEDKTLHYVDCLKEPAELHILQLDNQGEATGQPKIYQLEESVTVHFFRENQPDYICAYFAGVAFMKEDEQGQMKLEILKEIIPQNERSIRRFNDGGVDCQGRFWLAEIDRKALSLGMGRLPADYGEPLGRLWRYDPDGSLHLMEKGLVCGNGLAWSPDNMTMYLNDSAAGLVFAYDFDIPTGNLSNKRLFIDRRDLGGEPDGMVVSVDGNLWIAMWASSRVMVYDSKGKHLKDIKFSARNMACTSWGGPNYDTLYIASAMDKRPNKRSDDDGGHLFKYHVGVEGVRKYKFKG